MPRWLLEQMFKSPYSQSHTGSLTVKSEMQTFVVINLITLREFGQATQYLQASLPFFPFLKKCKNRKGKIN